MLKHKEHSFVVHKILVTALLYQVAAFSKNNGEETCQLDSSLKQWQSLLNIPSPDTTYLAKNQGLGALLGKETSEQIINDFATLHISVETAVKSIDSCYADTFATYIERIIYKKQQSKFPRTLIETPLWLSAFDNEEKSKKLFCIPRKNIPYFSQVQIVNSTILLEKLGHKNETALKSHYCAIVMFYAPWCPFCARAAPHFNALARAFPQLDVFAIDAISFTKFGTVAVPNILIFSQSKAVARYNITERTFEKFREFVHNVTGMQPDTSVNITADDYIGPLPSVPTEDRDYFLWFSWMFVIVFTCTYFARSHTGKSLWNYVENHMGHIEHAHID